MSFADWNRNTLVDPINRAGLSMLTRARALALFAAVLILTACPKNPTITVNNMPNEVGGTLNISGSGFTPSGEINLSALNTPGHSSIESIGKAKASATGTFSVDIPFSWPGPGVLPGCAQGSNSRLTVTITATDDASNSPSFATTDMVNCGTSWSRSPA